jgi:hypothetical protein
VVTDDDVTRIGHCGTASEDLRAIAPRSVEITRLISRPAGRIRFALGG